MLVAASVADDMPTHELRGPYERGVWQEEYLLAVPNYGNSTGCISPATVRQSRRPLYEARICCSNHKELGRGGRGQDRMSSGTLRGSKNERLDRRIP